MPFSFALPHDTRAQADALIALSLCGCELFNFITFWARILLLWKDCGPLLRGDNSRHCGPARVHVGILGADTGPLNRSVLCSFALPNSKCFQVGPK